MVWLDHFLLAVNFNYLQFPIHVCFSATVSHRAVAELLFSSCDLEL